MSTRIDTARRDWNSDGIFDETKTTTFEFTGGKLNSMTELAIRAEPNTSSLYTTNYGYDAAGRQVVENLWQDNDFNGTWQHAGAVEKTYDAAGRVDAEYHFSPDFDGDGMIGDYQTWILYDYNRTGQITAKNQDFYTHGAQGGSGNVDETWTYDTAGKLTQYRIDDPGLFDTVITKYYAYNRAGLLGTIKEENNIRHGDDRPRTDESNTWNPDGSIKTHTSWADYSDKGWFQRVDTAYTHGDHYERQLVTYDLQGDFRPEAIKLVEEWFNAAGQLTHTLTSHDNEGNGGPLAGGFDSRDLFIKTWAGDMLVAETQDFGADGVHEYQFDSVLV